MFRVKTRSGNSKRVACLKEREYFESGTLKKQAKLFELPNLQISKQIFTTPKRFRALKFSSFESERWPTQCVQQQIKLSLRNQIASFYLNQSQSIR